MELLLNEFSLNGQFESLDDFAVFFKSILRPVLDVACEKEIRILKKADFYAQKITPQISMVELLRKVNNPIATVLKQYIVQMAFEEPYWDMDKQTCPEADYQYCIEADEPNCFTEVIERKVPLYSFQHDDFLEDMFLCRRDGEEVHVVNIKNVRQLLLEYLKLHRESICYVLEKYPCLNGMHAACAKLGDKCYAEEALLENNLNYEDLKNILNNIPDLMNDLLHGKKTDLWDSFGNGLFEYRMKVSSNRIFRLFFVQREKMILFLNGFIKKTQSTPNHELQKARNIMRQLT